jgi:putative protease
MASHPPRELNACGAGKVCGSGEYERMTANPEHPELLAPAGGWDCLRAAVANGADAVYFGLPRFNARLRADNFRDEELADVVTFCHRHGVKAYVAFNTLVFTGEMDAAEAMLRDCSRAGVDALIVQDVGLVRLARKVVPELPIYASTQMTITSPEGVEFARELGVERVVLARELSLRDLEKFSAGESAARTDGTTPPATRHPSLPLEVFVHGALCVAYSGQCLTSESLGQRSANRGECAQACRMPYELIVDGVVRDLGDKRYLLSPQDLAAVGEIPALLERGVTSFKIEGRLKAPEYVAAVCQVYRRALDDALARREHRVNEAERYRLEMTFSRGLFTGWMHGVDHQRLVSARYGKKRGPFAGAIARVGGESVEFDSAVPLKPGDGIVFDTGGDTNDEQGGRIYEIKGRRYYFEHDRIDFSKLKPGDRVWKTDDPALDRQLRQSFTGRIEPRRSPVNLVVRGAAGDPLEVVCELPAGTVSVKSAIPLQTARTAPMTDEKLREHLGRFGEHPYALGELRNELAGGVILPISELNRVRRELAFALDAANQRRRAESPQTWREVFAANQSPVTSHQSPPSLAVLCRSMEQIEAALGCGVPTLYVDFEDIRRYRDAVTLVRERGGAQIVLATPRIQKAGEQGFFKLIENAEPDGVLIRNLGAIDYFRERTQLRRIGDFSLNVANPLAAQHFIGRGLERLTISYDLNIEQVNALLDAAPPAWFEITLHQHMPMFHMEHCVFAAFMSKGSSFLDCGRPCDRHRVHLRDRVGIQHPLRADVGCRNTLFNAVAQTGARFFDALRGKGLGNFRVELLEEDAEESARVIGAYQSLLAGERDGAGLWRELNAQSQLGVTKGTLDAR